MIMIILAPQPSALFLPATNAGWVKLYKQDLNKNIKKTGLIGFLKCSQ